MVWLTRCFTWRAVKSWNRDQLGSCCTHRRMYERKTSSTKWDRQPPIPISRSGRVACPRCLTQEVTQHTASTNPNLKVRKGGLPPLPHPRSHSTHGKHQSQSHGQEGWLAPAASPKKSLNTQQAPIPISRSGRVASPPCFTP